MNDLGSPDRPTKRTKLPPGPESKLESLHEGSPSILTSLHRPISPPPLSRKDVISPPPPQPSLGKEEESPQITIPSPIQLTHIRDFAASSGNNVDTVLLADLLGDPMIRECWQFNYLFDVDFLMSQFDEDVRSLVLVKIVHGSWKRESENRIRIDEASSRFPNVEPIVAYMPEPFGTHHSKMMILLRHDDLAQVIIHTANMIPGDWANMCQAVWRSPLLPIKSEGRDGGGPTVWGTGARFKRDLLAYLTEYGTRKTGPLVKQLSRYDFSAIRAALIASVPSKEMLSNPEKKTLWGWPALKDALQHIPLGSGDVTPHIVAQMSSIASLGQTDKWLKDVFFDALTPPISTPTKEVPKVPKPPQYSIIFPTADEIRRSLNGYASGGSIHMKLQSASQQKQLRYLRPYLRHWAGDSGTLSLPPHIKDAGRRRAAPHVKTYIRFTDTKRMDKIDWALVTSANLSTQAWGAGTNGSGEVRICSWEIGVLVWPELFKQTQETQTGKEIMVPCFKKDRPAGISYDEVEKEVVTVIGFRMPYDLPLTSYDTDDTPWCATMSHSEPDWLGQTWEA